MIYQLGPNNEYTLTESALNHILVGDFSDKQEKDVNNKTVLRKVIAGGLHTLDAWYSYLTYRSDIKHALLFEPINSENWYYLRQLQNGVVLLKIPRECFQSKAAKLTEFPETYYKSGYLWKTLFPINWGKEQILENVSQALKNIDVNDSTSDILIGYTNPNHFWGAIKIRIQLRNNEIQSAFPTWEQPMTGNNGKPFSHIDSINTIIADSTLISTADMGKFQELTINSWNRLTIEELYHRTPDFIKNRKPPKKTNDRSFQIDNWKAELKKIAISMSKEEVNAIFELVLSDQYLRFPFDLIRFFYNDESSYKLIKDRLKYRNTASIFQNLHDLLIVLKEYDVHNKSRLSLQAIYRLMDIHFMRTGGINQWEIKRLSNLIFEILSCFENKEKIFFLEKLQKSPLRVGWYVEFNLNPYLLKDPVLIGITGHEAIPLNSKQLFDFVIQNLGINYAANFDDNFNIGFVKNILAVENKKGEHLIRDLVSHAVASDFNYFAITLSEFIESLTITKELINIIDDIVFDYHRCLAANIQRVIVKYNEVLSEDLDFGDPGAINQVHKKHEYQFLWMLNKILIEKLAELYSANNFIQESQNILSNYHSLYKEVMKIPMPKPTPKYLIKDQELFEESLARDKNN